MGSGDKWFDYIKLLQRIQINPAPSVDVEVFIRCVPQPHLIIMYVSLH